MEALQSLTGNIYEAVYSAIALKGGVCGMDVNRFGDLNLVCNWAGKRSWRLAIKQYHSFYKMEGWVDMDTANKLLDIAEENKEKPIVAVVFPDGCVEFYSIVTGRKVRG